MASLSNSDQQKKYEDIHFIDSTKPVWNYSLFTEEDIQNFQNGTHYRLYEFFGNKELTVLNTQGTYFAVWAPNATQVSVIGNFNDWNNEKHILYVRLENSGIWEGFIPGVLNGESYKYHIMQIKALNPFISPIFTLMPRYVMVIKDMMNILL